MKELLENKVALVAGAVILAGAVSGTIYAFSRHTQNLNTVVVDRMDIVHSVTATGSTVPDQSVSLAFTEQGSVSTVNVSVGSTTRKGQVLASLDSSAIHAQLDGAMADVDAANAKLAQLQRGARPEELAVYTQKYADTSSALVTAMKNSYLQAYDAVVNKADTLFTNGNSPNPIINIRTQSIQEQLSIQNDRVSIGTTLSQWQSALAKLTANSSSSDQIGAAQDESTNALSQIKAYLDRLSTIANNLSTGNSGLSQTAINAYISSINVAGQEVSGATVAEQSAAAAYSSARDSLALEKAGSTSEDIQVAQAAVEKAQAAVEGYRSQLAHSSIVSPFDGIVTAVNIKVGQVFVPGISAAEDIEIMSNAPFKVETYVPETDIGTISVGDAAQVTFDAYGPSRSFPATVSVVDPAETVRNGSNVYKITLAFAGSDPNIKSGLTANVTIAADSKSDVLAVPTSAIITKGIDTFVLVKQANGSFAERSVQTGVTGEGYVEIVSGLDEGDAVAAFGN